MSYMENNGCLGMNVDKRVVLYHNKLLHGLNVTLIKVFPTKDPRAWDLISAILATTIAPTDIESEKWTQILSRRALPSYLHLACTTTKFPCPSWFKCFTIGTHSRCLREWENGRTPPETWLVFFMRSKFYAPLDNKSNKKFPSSMARQPL